MPDTIYVLNTETEDYFDATAAVLVAESHLPWRDAARARQGMAKALSRASGRPVALLAGDSASLAEAKNILTVAMALAQAVPGHTLADGLRERIQQFIATEAIRLSGDEPQKNQPRHQEPSDPEANPEE